MGGIPVERVRSGFAPAVYQVDDFSTGRRENIAARSGDIDVIEGDLTDPETVRDAVSGVDYILHLGAIPSVPRSVTAPIASNAANVTGTLNVLVAARDLGVNEGTLGNWVQRARAEREGRGELSQGDYEELKALRAEVAELRMERDVLKRSVVLWVKEATK